MQIHTFNLNQTYTQIDLGAKCSRCWVDFGEATGFKRMCPACEIAHKELLRKIEEGKQVVIGRPKPIKKKKAVTATQCPPPEGAGGGRLFEASLTITFKPKPESAFNQRGFNKFKDAFYKARKQYIK